VKFRPEAEIWPLMSDNDLKALAEDIDRQGQLEPISIYQGDILDGRNRWLAMTQYCRSGRRPKLEDVSPESPIAFVVSLNEQRRHLTGDQRAMAAARALPFYEAEAKKRMATKGAPIGAPQETKHRASDDAARAFGTTPRTVQRAKTVQKKGSRKLNEAVATSALSLGKAEDITKHYPDKKAQDVQVDAIAKSRMATRVKGLTGEVEWYTPRLYLDAAIKVMGAIDLDPASSDRAQEHVQASRYFTMETDGLEQHWTGRVWLNPPYAMPFIRQFVHKMTSSYLNHELEEGIMLTNNATDTEWFHTALDACAAVCFTKGRIRFLEARDHDLLEKANPTHGQAFFYFGEDLAQFAKVFNEYGTVVRPTGQAAFRGDDVYPADDE